MGSVKGATEIKRHPFFDGVSWALIRIMKPPVVVGHNGNSVRRKVSRERRWAWKWSSSNSKRNDEIVVYRMKAKEMKGKYLAVMFNWVTRVLVTVKVEERGHEGLHIARSSIKENVVVPM
ncbi:Protein kinase G11A [Dendrobium catenatum]|uniref:non-specific serine/threonine protein kinase n=1 Tax=Dendrobium catenatum TaxID=906689 RepID=A0A2I0VB00_9ASPA|nr:Protein kinase G11A [Dendrobium catenatum]